jgi:hypothetical protein
LEQEKLSATTLTTTRNAIATLGTATENARKTRVQAAVLLNNGRRSENLAGLRECH